MATTADAVERPRLDPPNIVWFFGGLTAAAAGNAVVSRVHPSARGLWILLAALAFLAVFAALSAALLRAGWPVPGGVLAAMAVTFVVPAGVGLLRLVGFWRDAPGIAPLQEYEGPLVAVAVATTLAGLAAFALVGFPFILAVVAAAAALGAQLLLPIFVARPGPADHANGELAIGVALVAVGIALDLRRARRAAFWWTVVGLSTFALGRAYHATWGLFGVAGLFAAAAHYLDASFGTLGTAFALAALGLGLVALGIGARLAPGVARFDT